MADGAAALQHVFDLVGGKPSLDFVNTVSGKRGQPSAEERLLRYEDLLYWGQQVGLLDEKSAARLSREAARHPRKAEDALAEAIRAREALHDAVHAALDRRDAPEGALRDLNRWIADALAHRRLVCTAPGCMQLGWEDDGDLLAFLRPIAADAAQVLAGDLEQGRVRRCEQGTCEWVFVDETRNRSRRWCSMKDCGNRAKARRHYERMKARRPS